MLPRLQLLELTDQRWLPAPLRDTVIEALSRALDWGRMLEPLVEPFRAFVAATGSTEVLDVCAGSGGPARVLSRALARHDARPPRFVMTDLYPRLAAWRRIRDELPGVVDFVAEPVDATNIPEAIGAGRARVVINAFHHFPPHLARAIVADAVRGSRGIWISEGFDRNPLRFLLPFAPAGLAALAAGPWLTEERALAKGLLTYLTPLPLAVSLFDGLVSTLRVYSEAELRDMVAPFGDELEWTYGEAPFAPFGRAYYFYGVPRTRRACPSST